MSALDDGWSFLEPAADRPEARLAVRLAVIVAGCGIACVAALLPGLSHRLGLDAGDLVMAAVVLLSAACVGAKVVRTGTGIGSGTGTGTGRRRFGPRRAVLVGGLGSALMLPTVALSGSPVLLAAALFAFGLCAGALDAAMHATADEVARAIDPPRRPGLPATYVAAGAGGALVTTLLLVVGFEPPLAAALVAAPMAIAVVVAWPYVLEAPARER
jgi:MFS family permease